MWTMLLAEMMMLLNLLCRFTYMTVWLKDRLLREKLFLHLHVCCCTVSTILLGLNLTYFSLSIFCADGLLYWTKVSYASYHMCRFDPDKQFWHSSLIKERLHRRVVCTSTGTSYKLVGKIVKPLALAQGISIHLTVFFSGHKLCV